jgi:hypothetical protein
MVLDLLGVANTPIAAAWHFPGDGRHPTEAGQ